MKKVIASLFLLSFCLTSSAFAGSDFDRMKSLVGEWESSGTEGKTRVRYELISNGTALMETIISENMVTIYHPDGEATLMTHYCAIGNQPRMRAQSSRGGDTIAFQFVDVANLKKADEGHMRRLVIKFQDKDHLTQDWTWRENGKEVKTTFRLQRVK